jgi:hypothetical protein
MIRIVGNAVEIRATCIPRIQGYTNPLGGLLYCTLTFPRKDDEVQPVPVEILPGCPLNSRILVCSGIKPSSEIQCSVQFLFFIYFREHSSIFPHCDHFLFIQLDMFNF